MTDRLYAAHLHRAKIFESASAGPLAEYWRGYRLGMVDSSTDGESAERQGRERLAESALRGDEADVRRLARGCGYHDGRVWSDVTQHRGLLRLAIVVVGGGSVRGFAVGSWGVDEGSVRDIVAGSRPVPAKHYQRLLDLVAAEGG